MIILVTVIIIKLFMNKIAIFKHLNVCQNDSIYISTDEVIVTRSIAIVIHGHATTQLYSKTTETTMTEFTRSCEAISLCANLKT